MNGYKIQVLECIELYKHDDSEHHAERLQDAIKNIPEDLVVAVFLKPYREKLIQKLFKCCCCCSNQTISTVLHAEAKRKNSNLLKVIIHSISPENSQVLLKRQDAKGWTPLHYAVDNSDGDTIEVIKTAFTGKLDGWSQLLTLQDINQCSALQLAAWALKSGVVKRLLAPLSVRPSIKLDVLTKLDSENKNLLQRAIEGGKQDMALSVLDYLNQEQVYILAKQKTEDTSSNSAHLAIMFNQHDILGELSNRLSFEDWKNLCTVEPDFEGKTALQVAERLRKNQCADIIKQQLEARTPPEGYAKNLIPTSI